MKLSDIIKWRPNEHSEKTVRQEGRLFVPPERESALPDTLTIVRVVAAVALILISAFVKSLPDIAVLLMRIAAALVAGYDIVWDTVKELLAGNFTGDGLPVIVAVIAAFAIGQSVEASLAMTILQLALCCRRFTYCKTGETLSAAVSLPASSFELLPEDSLMLGSGNFAPADCRVVQGSVTADFSCISGRRTERSLKVGDIIPAGCAVLSGSALVEVAAPVAESAVMGLANAINGGFAEVTRTERAISSAAKYIIPEFAAAGLVLLALFPLVFDLSFAEGLRRVIAIIAIGSPVGALFAVPLVYYATMVKLRRGGVVFFGARALDDTAFAGAVVLEKSGTVTLDGFEISTISTDKMDSATFLKVAAHAAAGSSNPMAQAIVAAFPEPISQGLVSGFSEQAGWGVSVTVSGIAILLGTGGFMARNFVAVPRESGGDSVVYMAFGGIPAGFITLTTATNRSVKETVATLAGGGIDRIAMMSGDGREQDGVLAREIGVSEYYAECSDEAKARNLSEIRTRMDAKKTIIYVSGTAGSAPAAMNADVAIAVDTCDVGALGGAANALMLAPEVLKIPAVLRAGKLARRLAIGAALTALTVKLTLAVLAALGIAPLWFVLTVDSCLALALITGTFSLSKLNGRLK